MSTEPAVPNTNELTTLPTEPTITTPATEASPAAETSPTPAPAPAETPAPFVPYDEAALSAILPEGLEFDSEGLALLNKNQLAPETVKELLAYHQKSTQAAEQALAEAWTLVNQEWRAQIENDPEIGGLKLPATTAKLDQLIGKFGTPDLSEALKLTGAGNHPAITKFILKMANEIPLEPAPIGSGKLAQGDRSIAQRLYPNG